MEELLKRFALPTPAQGARERLLTAAPERAAHWAHQRYNPALRVAFAALTVVVIIGFGVDRLASKRLQRIIYSTAAAREVDDSARALAKELAETLDGDHTAELEKYFARSLGGRTVGPSLRVGSTARQNRDVWIEYLMEDKNQWDNETG
jgi:hypothetical protein